MNTNLKFDDWLYFKKNAFIIKLRALSKYYFFKRMDVKIGHNVFIKRGNGKHSFGNSLVVLDNSIFEVYGKNASIKAGSNCFLSYGVVIACVSCITIGNNVWVGEYTSIRDATHNFSIHNVLGSVPDKFEPITIGNNVWVGRGCLILPGTVIEDNVIIAANSVVKGHCTSGSIYGGCPAKFIKNINS